jgi:hypothetical protein
LVVDAIPAVEGQPDRNFEASIAAAETRIATNRTRGRRRSPTRRQILKQSWHSAPRDSSCSPRPACHAANLALREVFARSIDAFVSAFREAVVLSRSGVHSFVFPDWSFPPGGPQVRPAMTAGVSVP